MSYPQTSLILVAGGLGTRMGTATPKPFLELEGRAIVLHTLDAFASYDWIAERILVVPQHLAATLRGDESQDADWRALGDALRSSGVTQIVAGGARRQDSVLNGLRASRGDSELVLVHDAVRPFISDAIIDPLMQAIVATGAAIPAVPLKDTVKQVDASGAIAQTLERAKLLAAQTPQGFARTLLLEAFERFGAQDVTDDAQLVELCGMPVAHVLGSFNNIKLTTPEDIPLAQRILSEQNQR